MIGPNRSTSNPTRPSKGPIWALAATVMILWAKYPIASVTRPLVLV